jgi:UDPglucose 6-dehydrogenase
MGTSLEKIMKVGIVGKGFVGGAIYQCFKDKIEVEVYDVQEEKRTINGLESLVDWADYLFICVPTPTGENGACDISIVEDVVKRIADIRKDKLIIIKSTVTPGTTKRLAEQTGMKIAFNPEFLTEANAVNDFRYQPLIVVGADDEETSRKVWELYHKYISSTGGYMPIMKSCKTNEAEMFKYLANCFLATKVIFANEIKRLCDVTSIDYNAVAKLAAFDKRLGATHWKVPGPDGKLGYGGSCFPKDTAALLEFAERNGIQLWLLTEATYINDEIRDTDYFKQLEVIGNK